MTGSNQTTFAVSKQAGAALRELAKHHGLSSAALIEKLVHDERQVCGLGRDPDYFNWSSSAPEGFIFETDEGEFVLPHAQVKELADALESVANDGGVAYVHSPASEGNPDLEVRRRGLSTELSWQGIVNNAVATFTTMHARTIAKLLRDELAMATKEARKERRNDTASKRRGAKKKAA
jgi:hypothetical protein